MSQIIYYGFFIVIFQFGWAAVQVGHVSLITDLTQNTKERVELNAYSRKGDSIITKEDSDSFTILLVIGCVFGLGSCFWNSFGSVDNESFKHWQVYGSALLFGIGGTTMLIASLALTSDLIGINTTSSAFVFGTMSFFDKVLNGSSMVFIAILLYLSQRISTASAYCPAPDFFYPCQCISTPSYRYELTISCSGLHIKDMDIYRAFTRLNTYLNGSLSSKTFLKLEIKQTSIQNLYVYEIDLFRGLKFRHISVVDNQIENFDPFIFWTSYRMNRFFTLKGHKTLVNYNRRDPLPILNRFKRLEVLTITDTNYDRISKNAFSKSEQICLKKILFNNNEITHIESCAFFQLQALCVIDLSHNKIRKIQDLSFAIKHPSHQRLLINLHSNNLTDSSLSPLAFHGINRPIFLILSDNLLTHLEENIFAPLLLKPDNSNTVVLSYNPLVCDCRFQWIVRNRHLLQGDKIRGQPLCHDGRSIWSYSLHDLKPC
ncbi:unnamed protein product [Oppiella nova]|uniref:Uncharacterized protein n=1 Tax=Oppiella nova TaxID=334625 RepID=A0A7R9LF35_9ACAR|nr:unnamed protein product [Oppiella nova]CAG2163012.1 unnamed protein product [Oppiella nova]